MNGALALIRTLVDGDVDVCFMNPGTSEMHFVAALDRVPTMRAVLGLFEGVATGAADGYARMAGRPAATLLHLGPGLGNGLANLHNARRAQTPLVNIVGDHATYHRRHDAPLTSDIESLARAVSGWVRSCRNAESVAADAVEAMVAARTAPGQVATLILPADCAWNEAPGPARTRAAPPASPVGESRIRQVARVLRCGEPAALLLGNRAVEPTPLTLAARIAAGSGARLLRDRVVARIAHGAGQPVVERLPYVVDEATAMLGNLRHLILVASAPPVGFFAYPGKPSLLAPADCHVHTLAEAHEDVPGALQALASELGATEVAAPRRELDRPPLPGGALNAEKVWMALAALMPPQAIVSDEAVTAGRNAEQWMAGAPPHDWLHITGGAIGQGLPVATGAAVACPGRKVFAMQADGSAMYTLQSLWTQAREGLDVVTVLFANRAYAILAGELRRVGGDGGSPRVGAMLSLDNPPLDWVHLARGMGVPASRVTDADGLVAQLQRAIAGAGPYLIEAVL